MRYVPADMTTWLAIIGALLLLDGIAIVVWYACSFPNSQLLGPVICRGPSNRRRVALTFDDGPFHPFTEQILDVLSERQVRATFFVCGMNAERHPDVLRRIHDDGHEVGNHSYAHQYLYFLSHRQIAHDIDRTQDAVEKVTGHRAVMFRPPYGARWLGLYSALRQRQMKLVQWSHTGQDWMCSANEIVHLSTDNLTAGSIIVLHDGEIPSPRSSFWRIRKGNQQTVSRAETVAALPTIIDRIRAAGLEPVSVGELLSE